MQGFLFHLYEQKWRKFGWLIHAALTALDTAVVVLAFHLCVTSKAWSEEGAAPTVQAPTRETVLAAWLLVSLLGVLLATELLHGVLHAQSARAHAPR